MEIKKEHLEVSKNVTCGVNNAEESIALEREVSKKTGENLKFLYNQPEFKLVTHD